MKSQVWSPELGTAIFPVIQFGSSGDRRALGNSVDPDKANFWTPGSAKLLSKTNVDSKWGRHLTLTFEYVCAYTYTHTYKKARNIKACLVKLCIKTQKVDANSSRKQHWRAWKTFPFTIFIFSCPTNQILTTNMDSLLYLIYFLIEFRILIWD